MTTRRLNYLVSIFLLLFLLSCKDLNEANQTESQQHAITDPLPSWKEGEHKSAILSYVNAVTDPASQDFIPVKERIATIDNDGTLWSEQPIYFQFYFAMDRIKEMAESNPELSGKEPFRSILNDDLAGALQYGEKGLLEVVMRSHSNISKAEFEKEVGQWLDSAIHPTRKRPFRELVFAPMVELVDYLHANDFDVFIVSGGGIDFVRAWAEDVYKIPKHHVIGSSLKSEYQYEDGHPRIMKTAEIDLIDDKAGKPIGIDRYIGRKPVFAVGNSDGDLDMLRWADSNAYPSFKMYIHHTDAMREWAYDRDSKIGKLDLGLDEARAKNWHVVNMQEDWKVIFSFDAN